MYVYGVSTSHLASAHDACVHSRFDTAEVYADGNSEKEMCVLASLDTSKSLSEGCRGRVIKELDLRRTDLVVTTKLFWGHRNNPNGTGLSRKQYVALSNMHMGPGPDRQRSIIEGTQLCLERLGLDYVDVIFAHRPDSSGAPAN